MGEERKKKGRKDFISQEMITEMMFFFLKKISPNLSLPGVFLSTYLLLSYILYSMTIMMIS